MSIISIFGIGKKYGVKGSKTKEARVKLEKLGYIKKWEKSTYTVLKDFPESFSELCTEYATKFYSFTPDELLQEAIGILEELGDDIGSWVDGMSGTGLETTDKFQTLEEAGSTISTSLDEFHNIEFPTSWASSIGEVIVSEPRTNPEISYLSRRGNLGNAIGHIQALSAFLSVAVEDKDKWVKDNEQEIVEALSEIIEILDNESSFLEGIDIPGMHD